MVSSSEREPWWWTELLSVHLYGLMLVVAVWRLLDQLRLGLRPFGLHKLFHALLFALYALRLTASLAAVLAEYPAPYYPTFELLAGRFAHCAAFGCVMIASTYLVCKLSSLTETHRALVVLAFWMLLLTPVLATTVAFALRNRCAWIHRLMLNAPLSAFVLVAFSFVGVLMFLAASVALSVWISRSRRHSLALHGRSAIFLRGTLIAVATTLVLQLIMSIHEAFVQHMVIPLNVFLSKALVEWLPETVPTGIILLWIMRGRDSTRYVPLLLISHESPYHCATTESSSLLSSATVSEGASETSGYAQMRPRAPSDVEFTAPPTTATEYSVSMTTASPALPLVVLL
jgi:hypothetical protein